MDFVHGKMAERSKVEIKMVEIKSFTIGQLAFWGIVWYGVSVVVICKLAEIRFKREYENTVKSLIDEVNEQYRQVKKLKEKLEGKI